MKGISLVRLSILIVTALALAPFCSAQAKLGGDWQGTYVDANGTTFHLVWHVTAAPDGALTSTLDNVDESIFGIKARTTTVKGSDVKIEVDDVISPNGQNINLKGSFAGTLNQAANEVTGTWTQIDPPQDPLQITFKHTEAQPAPAAPATAPPAIAGDWSGTLAVGPAQLRLVLHLAAAKDGTLKATLDSIDQGANGIPVNAVALVGSKLSLAVDAVHGTYEGTVNKDASEIAGTWTQGRPLDLNFKRAQPQGAVPAPKPAAPSNIDGTWQGSLNTPRGALRILFKIVNMNTGLTATVQSPDQSPAWVPTTSVTRTGNKITIEMKAFGASFEGQINSAKDTIDGTFTQGDSIPLVLKKS